MDLKTTYLGLDLPHPVVASASPLSATLDGVLRLADAGAAAVVMASIYEEQIRAEELTVAALREQGNESQPEATGYFPVMADDPGVLDARLETLRKAAERTGVPVIASLNGVSASGWVEFARHLQQAGASAIELNIYDVPVNPEETSADVEHRYLDIVRQVTSAVSLPVAVKISPFFSAPGNLINQIMAAGAKGVVLFNRFYGPDIDLSTLQARSDLQLSTANDIRLPLTWIGLISHGFGGSIAASGGVQSRDEVVKYLLAGADVAMTTSALMRLGPTHIKVLVDGLRAWMEERGFASVSDLRGRSAAGHGPAHAEGFLRAQYQTILTTGYPGYPMTQ
jgi:dihydroorotate dehydrogenase (fumarate)